MKLLEDLIKIDHLEVWKLPDNEVGVCFKNFAYIKDGDFLIGKFGSGKTLEDAVRDYAREISGRTLVADPTSSSRKEIAVLLIEKGED